MRNKKYKLRFIPPRLFKKLTNNILSSVYYFLQNKIRTSQYTIRVFRILEIQVSTVLVRATIVPYLFVALNLCFYRLVYYNKKLISNPNLIISLYETVHIEPFLQERVRKILKLQPVFSKLQLALRYFWSSFIGYRINYLWLLNNFLVHKGTYEVLIFEYPSLLLYVAPFKRFIRLYTRQAPNNFLKKKVKYRQRRRYYKSRWGKLWNLNFSHTILKLPFFKLSEFYKF